MPAQNLACVEVARLVRLARLARLVRVVRFKYMVRWYASARHCAWQVERVDVLGQLDGGDDQLCDGNCSDCDELW